ncbi:pentatricopeptide repeat-containing protein At4g21065 [Cryptomeria japonica]|uniref:pentatricopeptide repeat-containing protein At4g21065 n=1 Tax=Cryptomeria japonica TaxID=3369 RepID=UPI0025ACF905|nr:pentatricopeptide repeat-containing protein At4g21065 [Cryptomeria japonica]XP_057847956.1 pentatricopeptide repeat-containing protein At4g21065 [Cryptomeria japonica]XP_057847963.1 pentatricopeptide repeat-containing protein At4g21065 [Cryptomeria japonica]XP_057847969.1 pentatricopeptide repeat-containing protein At4g21065 [Cryptomeria japonica]XP_057847970.1 pentatricopeptide repeat-containing protein At4g21065 [Cryptomeria japonica]
MLAIADVNLNMRTLCREGRLKEAIHILLTSPIATVYSSTYLLLLQICIGRNALPEGKKIHSHIKSRGLAFARHTVIQNTLIDMYVKCGSLPDVSKVFNHLAEPNVFSWNMIITAQRRHGFSQEAFSLFRQMQRTAIQPDQFTFTAILPACAKMGALEHGMEIHKKVIESNFLSDVVVVNALIDMYSKCGRMLKAYKLFDKMPARNVVSWTAIIAGYAQNGFVEMALEVFKEMQSAGVEPNAATFTSVLPACAKLGALEQGINIHKKISERRISSDIVLANALINMYAKCGSILQARELFDKMPHPDVVSWTGMIAGYAMNGSSKDALKLFELMKRSEIKPDHISFVCVLFACIHAGLVDEGCKYFNQMSDSHCIIPTIDHYVCMIDILGRAGYLEESINFIIKMPFKPDVAVWMSLLSTCRAHKNIGLGEFVTMFLCDMDPQNPAPCVLLSNIYAELGRWDDVRKVRKLMKDREISKRPGCSWIEVHQKVHAFHAGDRSHPQTRDIYAKLDSLSWEMKAEGYIPDTRPVLNDVEDEEKKFLVCHHSEKLAIAFGLLNMLPRTTIRVVKNLRVCADCHTAIKYISKIVAREIFVRDANRFHHFKLGQCSCGDYW